MAGKITEFLREVKLPLSSILTILGIFVILIAASGMWIKDLLNNIFAFYSNYTEWSLYLLIFGFICLGFGIWYLYSFLKDRKFILEELETKKRSEFLKKHSELKVVVKHMPSKYRKMVKEKEDELNVK